MKRLIVCCDGTWNTPDQEENGIPTPTNVYKFYNALDLNPNPDQPDAPQLAYYHPGVGAEGGLLDSVLGGTVGAGIGRHIQSAYHWLGRQYAPGDAIYLLGFSRGAFTARSLGGLLARGLLDLREAAPADSWARVKCAYEAYRDGPAGPGAPRWVTGDWPFYLAGQPVPVRFIGVWDTVGALGVPDELGALNLFDDPKKWRFHDTELGLHVATARHAMAIDERRSSFTVTRWSNADRHPDARQLWFPGVHADVGGGYADCALSNGALRWMMEEAAATGLEFRAAARALVQADPCGPLHNSCKGAFARMRTRPRDLPAMVPANQAQFHLSALERQRVSPVNHRAYHPTRLLAVGEACSLDIFADQHWNRTGVYLPAGQSFAFSATGEWQDASDSCGWEGPSGEPTTVGDLIRGLGTLGGKLEGVLKELTHNDSTDLPGTKRVESLNWFELVGAIANNAGGASATADGTAGSVPNDGSPAPHQCVGLPRHREGREPLRVEAPGYLYCFANDAWGFYGNNHGSVRLTIRRVA